MKSAGSVLAASVGLLLALAVAGCGGRGDFPSKPIVLVCPWSPGGGTDRVARQLAVQLEQVLDVPVNVVNATGGGGVTGHTRAAVARPDGYTLAVATVELNMLHWRGMTGLDYKDFELLALLNRDDAAVFVRQDAPWQTIADLEAAVRERPGQLKASGTARGGVWHIALAGWLVAEGLDADAITWISINGAGPSLQELLAEGVDLVCCSVPEARSLMDGGQVRCLGVMADTRLPAAPQLPTFRESGADWAIGGWRGLVCPKGVPPERVEVLRKAALDVARSDEFAAFMDSAGFNLSVGEPEAFRELLAEMDERFGKILNSPAFARISESPIGPMVFPGLVAAASLALLLILLFRGGLRRDPDTAPLDRTHLLRLAWAPLGVVLFLALADTIGFVLTGSLLLLGLMLVLRVRPVPALVITAVFVPALYHVFAVGLGVPLPWGWLGW